MNCRSPQELIQKSLDEGLTPADRAKADAHLSACAACRAAWDEHHRLSRLAARWVPKAEPTETAADLFTRQVLDRIAARTVPAPSRPDFRWPLAALCLLAVALAFLPHPALGGLPDLGTSVRALPGWLLTLGRALPGDVLSAWHVGQALPALPLWLWAVLPAAGLLNGLFLARTRRRILP